MSRPIEELKESFKFLVSNKASRYQISSFINSSEGSEINSFGELADNICVLGVLDLTEKEKSALRRYSSAILVVANKKASIKRRREVLAKNPGLVRALALIALSYLWPKN